MTDATVSAFGTFQRTTADAAQLQLEYGERLRGIHMSRASELAQSFYMSEWTYDAAAAWSALLLDRELAWSDGTRARLEARLARTGADRLCILPHGPTCLAPWGLLKRDGRAWLEAWELVVCSSWRRPPWNPDGERCIELRLPPAEPMHGAADPEPGTSLFARLAGHHRAWIGGHGRFLPPTHGDSEIVTLLDGTKLAFGLRRLIADACAARASGLHVPTAIVMSVCEAAEVSRRARLTELVTLAQAALIAGATSVLAPKWSNTDAGDAATRALLDQRGRPAASARELLAAGYAPWRACRIRDDVEALVRRGLLPLCDLGALELHGYIIEPEVG